MVAFCSIILICIVMSLSQITLGEDIDYDLYALLTSEKHERVRIDDQLHVAYTLEHGVIGSDHGVMGSDHGVIRSDHGLIRSDHHSTTRDRYQRSDNDLSPDDLDPLDKGPNALATCTIRRYKRVYYFGMLSSATENVTSDASCAYLCWKRRTYDGKECTSVNYLRNVRRCEFMQDKFGVSDNSMINFYAQRNPESSYVIPIQCGEAINTSSPDSTETSIDSASSPPSDPTTNITVMSVNKLSCGQSFPGTRFNDLTRIVGGAEARPHSHPWIVSLQNSAGRHFCGGTLLRVSNTQEQSDIVVTAAHCLQRLRSSFIVGLGFHSLRRAFGGERRIKVRRYITHRGYSSRSNSNDIGIIQLIEPVTFTPKIQPVCLPSSAESTSLPADTVFTVAGWGDRREGGGPATELREVQVPMVNTFECASNYAEIGLQIIASTMLCAGIQGKDSCQGDSGGPLTLRNGKSYVLHGIVSFGEGCARARKPGVYARVSTYVDWINDQIKTFSALRF